MTQAMTAMPKYESYKDSSSKWMGQVPANWEVTCLGPLLKPISQKNRPDLPLLSITREQGVIIRDVEDQESNHNFIPDDLSGYKVIKKGQFGMNKMKAWQGSYGVSDHTGIVSPAYFIFDFTKPVVPEYFHWAIRSRLYVSYFASASDGVRIGQWDLSKPRMKVIPFLVPSVEEQTAIAKFLDEKTMQIDEAIGIKERQIALLKERQKILVQESVSQGLVPDVKMKDSGIAWIGKVPEHWEVALVKHTLRKLERPRKQDGNTVICSNNGCSKLLGDNKQGLVSLTQHDYQGVNKGDLLIHGMDIWHGAISISEHTGDCTSVVHVCDSTHNKGYIAYFLKMLAIMNVYKLISNGVRQNTSDFRSWKKFGDIQLVLPSKEEQRAIVEFLDEQTKKMNQAVDLAKEQIIHLKEYKASLINSAVTGKIKVI
ncbi:MAG: restriction endonuclease subunit S [Chlamydiota bacterium]